MTYFYHFLGHICYFVSVTPVTFEIGLKIESGHGFLSLPNYK